jgi:hypothetical protein
MNDVLARIAGDSRRAKCLAPAARAKFSLAILTQGSARKASLHPGLYALAHFVG